MTATPLNLPAGIELVVFDMAGTTVQDGGVVERAFQRASETTGVADWMPPAEALDYVRKTMGQSKIDVFTHLARGDRDAAKDATAAFEAAYATIIATDGVDEVPGAADTFGAVRDAGLQVALTTGFSPVTRDAILTALGWHGLVEIALSPSDVGRGRPAPDLVLTALIRARASSVDAVAVVGDTVSDIASGRRAGAGHVVGVLSGAHDRATLMNAGAHAVLDDITGLVATRAASVV